VPSQYNRQPPSDYHDLDFPILDYTAQDSIQVSIADTKKTVAG